MFCLMCLNMILFCILYLFLSTCNMILNVPGVSALIQMRERFLKNQMNGQFFEKMRWRQFLCIFSHGLRGKYLQCGLFVNIFMLLVLGGTMGTSAYITEMKSWTISYQSTHKDS